MQLPLNLRNALDRELQGVSLADLTKASQLITDHYRAGKPARLTTLTEQHAYVAARMPATYAAVHAALSQCSLAPRTLLDLGAGPGTVTWAAQQIFPSLVEARHVEHNRALAQMGERLGSPLPVTWLIEDLAKAVERPPADLVVLSYALNEVSSRGLLEQAWQSTTMLLAIVEPGTPSGFKMVRAARDWLLAQGGHVIAPCPHAAPCPIIAGDWCHFAARVQRTSLHRRMKGAELGYEDEKFSYVLIAREPVIPAQARIIRHPQHKSGYVQLELCTRDGLQRSNIPKSAGATHRAARKATWGDPWEPG